MELDDATRDELAGFYARRFPTDEARASIARAAGLSSDDGAGDPRAAWTALLARADRGGVLARLADAACAAAPEDRNLAEARGLLRGDRPPGARGRPVAAVAAAVLIGLVGVGGAGAWWLGSGAGEAPAEVAPGVDDRAVNPIAARPAAEDGEVENAPAGPEVAPAAPVPAEPVAQVVPELVPVTQPPSPTAASPGTLGSPIAGASSTASTPRVRGPLGRCQGAPGVVVGWWYAGTTAPGAVGATISLSTSVNVRDDYPRKENRYALAGQVLCSLPAGTSQRLSEAPVDIGQGHWWVPVAGGDIGG